MQPGKGQPTDADLLLAARAGEAGCLGLLLERHRPRLHATALRMLGYGPEAEDAVHETFLVALQRIGEVREPDAVGAWLVAVLRRTCLQHLRRRRAEVLTAQPPEIADERISAEDQIERLALRDWVWSAMQRLPEPLRVTAMLRYFGSYDSYEEVAAILAVPVGTVRSRLSQVKRKLAEALLASAGLVDGSAHRVSAERHRFYDGLFHDIFFRDGRQRFLEHFQDDLRLVLSNGPTLNGRAHLAATVDEDVQARVVTRLRRSFSGGDVTVLEAQFLNPPEAPDHCPPGMALVFFRRGERVHRIHLHLAPRPPREGDD
jgi:RNA polymerase sigma factor (sigma-70 family)